MDERTTSKTLHKGTGGICLRRAAWIAIVLIFLATPALTTSAAGLASGVIFLPAVQNNPAPVNNTTIVVDHRHTDISQIPDYWIQQAKTMVVHYAHTSHGSQILTGLWWLETRNSKYNVDIEASGNVVLPDDATALRIYEGNNYSGNTYITPDMYWESTVGQQHTRSVLQTGYFNVSLWTWCGQMSSGSTDVDLYLDTLAEFDDDYPGVRTVYYTGHTDGSSAGSDLWINNNTVRSYVAANNAVLFDFADIESYDPDGNFYPHVSDSCEWCEDWCEDHSSSLECQSRPSSCAHSDGLQCTLKGQAFWWLMARMAGWDGVAE